MDNQEREKGFQERRIARAVRHVGDNWMPVNPVVLLAVQEALDTDRYEQEIELLVSDLKQDVSLFAYCLRELCLKLKEDGVIIPDPKSISELFDYAGLERLKEILAASPREISPHSLRAAEPLQTSRFQEALLSASTSEVFCESADIDPEIGFTSALLRQLGLTLISWNYPDVYETAVRNLPTQRDLDTAIASILGYSPSLIAVRLLKSWGLPATLVDSVAIAHPDFDIEDYREFSNSVAEVLSTICKAGEALARANNPQVYPTARQDWSECKLAIESRLGSAGLQKIQTRFEQNCGSYVDLMPELFRPGMLINPQIQGEAIFGTAPTDRNPFIELCRPHVRAKLVELYGENADATSKRRPLFTLLHEIIPLAGFTGGCVFTADPTTMQLIPQSVIGTPVSFKAEPIAYSNLSHFIIKAFSSPTLEVQENVVVIEGVEEKLVSIAWAVGFSQRIGALLLEVPTRVFEQSPNDQINHFQAVLQALNDCLELR